MRILKDFKLRVLEVRIVKELWARFLEVRILKEIDAKEREEAEKAGTRAHRRWACQERIRTIVS